MPGNGQCQHFQNIGGGGIHQHAHKLHAHDNGQQFVKDVTDIGKIFCSADDDLIDFQRQGGEQDSNGDDCDEPLNNMQYMQNQMLASAAVLLDFLNPFLHLGIVGKRDLPFHKIASRYVCFLLYNNKYKNGSIYIKEFVKMIPYAKPRMLSHPG